MGGTHVIRILSGKSLNPETPFGKSTGQFVTKWRYSPFIGTRRMMFIGHQVSRASRDMNEWLMHWWLTLSSAWVGALRFTMPLEVDCDDDEDSCEVLGVGGLRQNMVVLFSFSVNRPTDGCGVIWPPSCCSDCCCDESAALRGLPNCL